MARCAALLSLESMVGQALVVSESVDVFGFMSRIVAENPSRLPRVGGILPPEIVERTARLGPVPLVRVAGEDVDNHAEVPMTDGNRRLSRKAIECHHTMGLR
jgi:hypothetical protein